MLNARRSIAGLVVLITIALLGASFWGCVPKGVERGESVLEKVKREKVIHAGYIKYPPFVIQDPKTRELSGYFIDLMAQIAELMGVEIEYEETNWGRMIAALETGKVDVVVSGIFRTIPRAMQVTFTKPVLYVGISAIIRKEDTRFKELEDFEKPGLTVAVTDGEVGHEYAKRYLLDTKLIVLETEDITRPMLEVITGRADVALGDAMSCYRFAKEHKESVTDLFAGRPFYVFGTTLMIRRGDPEWLDFLNLALEFMENSGFTDKLEKKYKEADAAWLSAAKPWRTETE